MNEDYTLFKKFFNLEDSVELCRLLEENQIEYELKKEVSPLNSSFTGTSPVREAIELKIKQEDFAKAEEVLQNDAKRKISSLDREHYLFDFSDKELMDVLLKYDEWSKTDYLLAVDIFRQRGIVFTEPELNEYKQKRLEELRKPEKAKFGWIIFAYFAAAIGGFVGIVIAYSIMVSKTLLSNAK